MASSLFQQPSQSPTPNPTQLNAQFNQFKQSLGPNPQAAFNQAMQQNQGFREFVQNNQGKSIPQIMMEMMSNRGGSTLH